MFYIRLKGGLGNQMFQYAFGKGLSYSSKEPVQFDTRFLEDIEASTYNSFRSFEKRPLALVNFPKIKDAAKTHFISLPHYKLHGGIIGRIFDKLKEKISPQFINEKRYSYDSDYESKVRNGSYFNGNWQSYKYFNNIEKEIRSDFSFAQSTEYGVSGDEVNAFENEVKNSESVCIHVRRGDMANNPRAHALHGTASIEYYKQAIQKLLVIFKNNTENKNRENIKWFVFSDDISWCKEHIQFDGITLHFFNNEWQGNNSGANTMRIMSLCKHFIIPNSTFGWWAAWLSVASPHKTVITPKHFFKTPGYNTLDLIPQDWITIDTPLD